MRRFGAGPEPMGRDQGHIRFMRRDAGPGSRAGVILLRRREFGWDEDGIV